MSLECRLCSYGTLEKHLDFGNQPIVHHLLNSNEENAPTFPFQVGACTSCGFVQLTRHIAPEILYKNYFTLSSWKDQPHSTRLIQVMSQIYDLEPDSSILEVGCNDGTFLDQLRKTGFTNLLGIEPANDAYEISKAKNLNVIHGFLRDTPTAPLAGAESFDLIVSRQVLEHIADLHDFMTAISKLVKPGGGLVFEVPDHEMNLKQLDYTFWEEHVNYFTLNTLTYLLNMHGFSVVHSESTLFSGKCLLVFAYKNSHLEGSIELGNIDKDNVQRYFAAFPRYKDALLQYLDNHSSSGIAAIGAGARSCNFINLMDIGPYIDAVFDDQLEKQDKIIPGCRLQIEAFRPKQERCLYLLGVNCESEGKVIRRYQLKNAVSILPPSLLLPAWWRKLAYQ